MPRSISTLAPANAVVARRFIASLSLVPELAATRVHSASTTSHGPVAFRRYADLGRDLEGFRCICIEERSQIRVPPCDLRHVEGPNSHVLEEAEDLLFPFGNSLRDKR